MSYTAFRNAYLTEAENRLASVNVSTASTNDLLIAGALYKMAAAVAEADLIGPSALRLLEAMSGEQLQTWLQDAANRETFERILSSPEAMRAVAASSSAWNAVVASSQAMAEVAANSQAMAAVLANSSAWNAVVASSQAMAAVLANSSAWNAVVASSQAMAAVAANSQAMAAVLANSSAWNAVVASSQAMAAVAANSQAMAAVLANSSAWNAVVASSQAMAAVAANSQAMAAVAANSQAMAAVAASQNALAAIRQSSAAISAINASSQALDILYNAATKFTYAGGSWSTDPATLVTGNFLLVRVRQINNPGGWSNGTPSGQYIRIGGSGWTATNGQSTHDLINRTTLPHVYDNALRPVNNTTIQYYLFNSYEIAYLAA